VKRSRRNFLKTTTTALGSLALPPGNSGAFPDAARTIVVGGEPSGGSVTVNPDEGVAGEYGTWTVTYRVGPRGIKRHGGIRVQLPDAWHAGVRNSANRLQSSDPRGDNYISGKCLRTSVRLRTWVEDEPPPSQVLVKSARYSLDGRYERYVYVVRVWVTAGELEEGETLAVTYGDTSRGSKGMRASIICTHPELILVAVDSQGSGLFRMHPDRPTLVSHAGPPAELMVWGPATLVVGKEAELGLAAVDVNANPAAFDGEVELRVTHGRAKLPSSVRFQSQDGWMSVPFVPTGTGILRVEARVIHEASLNKPRSLAPHGMESGAVAPEQAGLRASGNPMKVFETQPELKTHWGELHSHSHYSWDGVGDDNFRYARNVSGLDFYAMTDHCIPPLGQYTQGLAAHVWQEYTAKTEKHYEPGRFVTIHAYECSLGAPYGHHNVFFRSKPGPLLAEGDVTLPELWNALTAGEALTIPHHTGKMPQPILWFPHNDEIDRNIEIYSAHGLSEAYDPEGPLAFERSDFTDASKSVRGPQYVQDAWLQGLKLSTVAATDDHRAHPGQPHYGRAAVAATGLTREEIFDGLYHRRTYGTTGAKILLDFSINGEPMGGTVAVTDSPRLEIEAHGTDGIEFVQVLRHSKSDGAFVIIYTLSPDGADFTWSQTDATFNEDSIYYVRLRQVRTVRTRVAMAWSSPIWVRRA
jgi:hypothetical protein